MGKYRRKSDRKLMFTEDILKKVRERIVNGESVRSIASSIGCPESSLRKRLAAGRVPTSLGRFERTFDANAERELAAHCRNLDDRFYGLTTRRLMEIAYEYAERNGIEHRFNTAKRCAGRDWVRSFCKRHNISVRSSEKCSIGRVIGFDRAEFNRFFYNLRSLYTEKKFLPGRIFNVDETGISTIPNSKGPEAMSQKGKRLVGKAVAGERGELVTVVCCFSATGVYVPPALVFPRKRMRKELFEHAPSGTLPLISETGFINGDLFLHWLKHFQKHVKPSEEDPVLLILDNHVSHCTLDAINFCREHFISLLSLPPRASHKLQPLDRGFFGPLMKMYVDECEAWMVMNPGCSIKLDQVAGLFSNAYTRLASVEKALASFASCGIYPLNPTKFGDEDFLPSEGTDVQPHETASTQEERSVDKSEPFACQSDAPPIVMHPEASYLQKRRRNGRKSEVMTFGALKSSVQNKKDDSAKRRTIMDNDMDQPGCSKDSAITCPGCGEKSTDSPVADWIQCKKCFNWWNEACSCYECGELTCDHC